MALRIASPNKPVVRPTNRLALRSLDRTATETGYGWKRALALAGDLFGKTKNLSLAEIAILKQEIKKRKGVI